MNTDNRIKKRRLKDIDVSAIAFVDKGANGKRFFLIKRDEGGNQVNLDTIDLQDAIEKGAIVLVKDSNQLLTLKEGRIYMNQEEFEKASKETIDKLKEAADILSKEPKDADIKKVISILKDIVTKYPTPSQYPQPKSAETVKKAVEDMEGYLVEKAGASLSKTNKEKIVSAFKMMKEALGLLSGFADSEDEIDVKKFSEDLTKSIVEAMKG